MKKELEKIYQKGLSLLQDRLEKDQIYTDEDVLRCIDFIIRSQLDVHLSLEDRSIIRKSLFNRVRRLDILSTIMEDETITEIMINGEKDIFIEREGCLSRYPFSFESRQQLESIAMQIAAGCNRSVNELHPIVDARLADGARVHIVMPPIALNGPVITIRRFPQKPFLMEDMIRLETISQEGAYFLEEAVLNKYSIFISGGTSTGKTSFMNALSNYIPRNERIITIEDTAELMLQRVENLVGLEVRPQTTEGEHGISIRQLVKAALRMRPNRIIIGEVRGEEVIDLLMAMNTGHKGSMSSGHSNSPTDLISRLSTMFLMGMEIPLEAIERQIGSSIDLIIQLKRRPDGKRYVESITELSYQDNQIVWNQIFGWNERKQLLERIGELRWLHGE